MDLGVSRAITRAIDETMTGSGLALGSAGEPPFAGDKLALLAKAPSARYPDAAHVVDALSALHARSSRGLAQLL